MLQCENIPEFVTLKKCLLLIVLYHVFSFYTTTTMKL